MINLIQNYRGIYFVFFFQNSHLVKKAEKRHLNISNHSLSLLKFKFQAKFIQYSFNEMY